MSELSKQLTPGPGERLRTCGGGRASRSATATPRALSFVRCSPSALHGAPTIPGLEPLRATLAPRTAEEDRPGLMGTSQSPRRSAPSRRSGVGEGTLGGPLGVPHDAASEAQPARREMPAAKRTRRPATVEDCASRRASSAARTPPAWRPFGAWGDAGRAGRTGSASGAGRLSAHARTWRANTRQPNS